jgi:hypothetical protein
MWFLSGIVLMYCDYPVVNDEMRLAHLPALDAEKIHFSARGAAVKAQFQPDSVVLSSILSRPIYRLQKRQKISVVYADTNECFRGFTEEEARKVAGEWVHQPPSQAHLDIKQITEDDQWTVQQEYRAYRPLWKFSWPTGEETYVSDVTGEVVQYTTPASRLGAYLGAIPHWLYITQLRRDAAAWRLMVIWLSGIGTVMTVSGLVAGAWMYSPSKRYRYRGTHSGIPYKGQMRLHMILGLVFGLATFTWILSGMFSMTPIRWPANPIEARVRQGLLGGEWNTSDFENWSPVNALESMKHVLHPRQLELSYLNGEPVYLAIESPSKTAVASRLIGVADSVDPQRLRNAIMRAIAPYSILESRIVRKYDAYYVDREGRKRLPVLFVRLNDPQGTTLYIDMHSGRISQSYGRWARWNRWIYHGLHEFDVPWLYLNRPVWDAVVLSLMTGGTWLSVTGVIVGWRRLFH